MFSILLIAFVAASLGKKEEGQRIAFLAMTPPEKSTDICATFHLLSGDNTSYIFEFKFLFSDLSFTASVSVNESIRWEFEHGNLLLEIIRLKPHGFLLSFGYPRHLLSRKDVFVETETEMNSIYETRWIFNRLGTSPGEWMRVMAVSVAGEEISLKIGNGDEQTLNSTRKTNVNVGLEIKESLQGEVSSESKACVSFHFRKDDNCDIRRDDECKVLAEIFPKNGEDESVPKCGFWQHHWLYLLTLLSFGTVILAYLCPKDYIKPCVPYSSRHHSSLPECEGTHSNSAAHSLESLQSTNLPRPEDLAFPHGSLPHADGTSRESINSEYFTMSDLARSPEAQAAGDCEGDAAYSHLQHITAVPVGEGNYDTVFRGAPGEEIAAVL
ncbi:uncharacterized protein LOC119590174 [Penaeus monodon]|uniref:uncharacterized protein LOC119590174 n=1 Tax=Penaeus monodon TaxID=6687 RepID=UPI0018A712CD|nr:uncharacterized protein LOC119590174 [Penaeus monodon]